MKISQLRKQPERKSCHGHNWVDEYSWIHQDNCLEILRDPSKLNPEVRKYLEEENAYTKESMKDTEIFQKKLFKEIEGRIKLDDEGLPYRDKHYEYWTKTTKEGNYFKKLRRKIGNSKIECYFDADKEAKGKKFFSCGDLTVSYNDELLIYSIDEKGSEYFTIFVRKISDGKIIEKIEDTAGGCLWAFDDKSFFYRKHDSQKRPRKLFQHTLNTPVKEDKLKIRVYAMANQELFEKGVGYKMATYVNWDPAEQTVLANEQVIDGKGWRSGATVERKKLSQWFFNIKKFSQNLLDELEKLKNWPEKVKLMQKNWIGKSYGCEINFQINNKKNLIK